MVALYHAYINGLAEHSKQVDRACQNELGISGKMFKISKNLVNLAALLLGMWGLYAGAEPMHVFLFVAFIINGPEAIETYILHKDKDE